MKEKTEQTKATNANPVLSIDKNGFVLYSNEASEPILNEWGVRAGEKLPSSIVDIVQKVISCNIPERIEVKVDRRVYLVAFIPLTNEKFVNIYGFDISDQKEFEAKLLENEEKYKAIFENSIDAVLFTSPDGTILAANPAACEMFRMSEEEIIQVGRNGILDLSDQRLKSALEERAKTGRFRGELNYRRKDGTIFPGEVSSAFFKDKNGVVRTTIIIRDITERKQAEESLKESEKRYRMLFTNMAEGFILAKVIWDKNGKPYDYRYLDINPGFDHQTGLKGEQLLGKSVLEVFPNPYSIEIEKLSEVALSGKSTRFEVFNQVTDKYFEVYAFSPEKGKIAAIFTDITERKKVQEALHESEMRLKIAEAVDTERRRLFDVLETLPVAIVLLTPDHHIAFANRVFSNKFGELDSRHCYDFCFGFNKPCEFCEAYKVLETGKLHRWEANMPDGSILDVYDLPFTDVDGSPMVLEMDIDVTDRKKAEEKLRESEEKYRNIVETANEGILVTDNESVATYVNNRFANMLGYTPEELIGKSTWGLISEEYKPIVKKNLDKRRQGISNSYELKLIRKDGNPIWTIINAKPLHDNDGRYIGAMSMFTDITAWKEAEESLVKIEIARKKEIHHRIKNNLQVISSLLDLQAEKFKDKTNLTISDVLNAFRESQDRVISMALIHEELHNSKNIEIIDIYAYFKELADNLFLTYRLGNNDINLDLDIEKDTFFDMDIAVPLGLIVNELLSNSLKYAFVDRNRGKIKIKLHKDGTKECNIVDNKSTNYVLTISDNGVGISENIDIENLNSLGLQLVTTLVDQLDGELELKRDNGTEFIIRFTVAESNNASETASQLV